MPTALLTKNRLLFSLITGGKFKNTTVEIKKLIEAYSKEDINEALVTIARRGTPELLVFVIEQGANVNSKLRLVTSTGDKEYLLLEVILNSESLTEDTKVGMVEVILKNNYDITMKNSLAKNAEEIIAKIENKHLNEALTKVITKCNIANKKEFLW